jgi:putative iron-regulated protein
MPVDSVRAAAKASNVTPQSVAQFYAQLVYANYSDTLSAAKELQQAINSFTAKPSEAGLKRARAAWLGAREFYGQTEVFRFYGGPIDGDNGLEGQLNAWPMDESYVDYVAGNLKAGLISDSTILIDSNTLLELNERGGEENISTGWHAIEFMLWGQDTNIDGVGAGARVYTDFVEGTAHNADRRRAYLSVITNLLVSDLSTITGAWAPAQDNYRKTFEANGLQAVRDMIVGMGSLSRGELAGERMEVPLHSQDQEDEHSCFSDNTHRDIVTNAQGILNVWSGSYMRKDGSTLSGASMRDLVATQNASLATELDGAIRHSVNNAQAIQAPFDREIIGSDQAPGRQRVQVTIDSLVQQSKILVSAATVIGITNLTLSAP